MKTVADLVRTRADECPERLACTFTAAGKRSQISFGELWEQVAAKAGTIASLTNLGDRCVLAMPPSLDFVTTFLGIAAAGRVAVPVPEVGAINSQSAERINQVVADCTPGLVVTGEDEGVKKLKRYRALASSVKIIARVEKSSPDIAEKINIAPDSLFMLQYTSGSVGHPKGVRLTHENILHNSATIGQIWGLTSNSIGVTWLPFFHDMGLLGGFMVPLRMGFQSHILSTLDMLRHPLNWLRMISELGATVTGGPDFGYRKCIERVSEEDLATLDLSTWEIAFSGSEPVSALTMKKFARHFSSAGFRAISMLACYGLAENTLFVTSSEPSKGLKSVDFAAEDLEQRGRLVVAGKETERMTQLVANGRVSGPIGIKIIDDDGVSQPSGIVGEVAVVQNPSTADGYWNSDVMVHKGLLRTGDLGAVHDGDLYITGRKKDVMIFSGRNLYPVDVERAVQALDPSLEEGYGAVFSVSDDSGRERGVVVLQAVHKRENRNAETARWIAREVAIHFGVTVVDVVLVARGAIPRTTSGKVQRAEAKRRYELGEYPSQGLHVVREMDFNPIQDLTATVELENEEMVLATILELVVRLVKVKGPVSPDIPFTELGLNSVDGVQLVSELSDATGYMVEVTTVYDYPTPRALASYIVNRNRSQVIVGDDEFPLLMDELSEELKEQ